MALPSGEHFGKRITANDRLALTFFLMNKIFSLLCGPSENNALTYLPRLLRSQLSNWIDNMKMLTSDLPHIKSS